MVTTLFLYGYQLLAFIGLQSKSESVRDAAVGALESWGGRSYEY